ncbi:MAG: alkyl hydroperoxide reductase/Thiol specific antioxidant/Mal allergen [Acidobacteria bacterium]|nr:alkyl hydroperoxide reductase/Thiol specific antioxidant/Mal allergen [Acidobacteriota bacterium]
MNEENGENRREIAVQSSESKAAAVQSEQKQTFRKRALGWLGYLAVTAAILFFFAPESWWQFGVAPVETRKTGAAFSLHELNGAEWNFEEKRGRVVVVNYWATWCPPCRVETPGLVSVAGDYKDRGVELVGVTLDEDLSLVPPFIESYRIKYPILLPGNDPNLSAEGMALPTTFLYDKNGRLAKKYTGMILESTLKSDIELLLAEN